MITRDRYKLQKLTHIEYIEIPELYCVFVIGSTNITINNKQKLEELFLFTILNNTGVSQGVIIRSMCITCNLGKFIPSNRSLLISFSYEGGTRH